MNSFIIARQKWCSLFDEYKSAKFRRIILKQEFAIFEFDLGVASTHRDVIDAQVTFMTTAQLEYTLGGAGSDDMYDS